MNKILVTGSAGLIGSDVTAFFASKGWHVIGIDNNMRADFFGSNGDTKWNRDRLVDTYKNYEHHDIDLRDRNKVADIVKSISPDAVVHTAAQPSHDLAASRPFDDFDVNAVGTLNMLESVRRVSTRIPFVHLSTNKVYGDAPNRIAMVEKETRWDYADQAYKNGIAEDFTIDQSMHSVFGASKVAADVMVQEYGRYFQMPTCCLRGGCLTGPNHSGVELHGFLSYLIKCNLEGKKYRVFGYKGKQVRDNIHSNDVALFINAFINKPRLAEVYNIGGGRENSISILEAFKLIESISGKESIYEYVDENRKGDHICYISDLTKMKEHYPGWSITKDIKTTFGEIYQSWNSRMK
ncbi:MAG: NAD-dependent epimerase/dehydratase family protein [Cytophagales bacterium]|jgi:CDP-paratose 2-epimerase|nr:NAD-dependent epimerase/dehydratase family protein [Cytophagales bacterium]MCA6369595.1 NAD-dependent epimerase/dehydratase family protein [Cytophagales bacterium]MCA6370691.1 NAD-dependent epimerase/dehydratase family protein [Cytophagales bacterium]MCA6383780.1 NAD-dependent epimerase/dehydratase family protein [Cytophagales bacterium]